MKYIHSVMQILPLPISRTFPSSQAETLYQLNNSPFLPSPTPGNLYLLHFLSVCLSSDRVNTVWFYFYEVNGLFHFASCFWRPWMWYHVSEFHSFLKLNIYHILFIHSAVNRHLSCFYLLAIFSIFKTRVQFSIFKLEYNQQVGNQK